MSENFPRNGTVPLKDTGFAVPCPSVHFTKCTITVRVIILEMCKLLNFTNTNFHILIFLGLTQYFYLYANMFSAAFFTQPLFYICFSPNAFTAFTAKVRIPVRVVILEMCNLPHFAKAPFLFLLTQNHILLFCKKKFGGICQFWLTFFQNFMNMIDVWIFVQLNISIYNLWELLISGCTLITNWSETLKDIETNIKQYIPKS